MFFAFQFQLYIFVAGHLCWGELPLSNCISDPACEPLGASSASRCRSERPFSPHPTWNLHAIWKNLFNSNRSTSYKYIRLAIHCRLRIIYYIYICWECLDSKLLWLLPSYSLWWKCGPAGLLERPTPSHFELMAPAIHLPWFIWSLFRAARTFQKDKKVAKLAERMELKKRSWRSCVVLSADLSCSDITELMRNEAGQFLVLKLSS